MKMSDVIADFIGESNIVPGTMIRDELVEIFGARFACVDKGFGNNKPVDVVIRPEDIDLVKPEDGTLQGVVTHLIFKGVHYEMEVTTPDGFEWLVHSTDMFPVGRQGGTTILSLLVTKVLPARRWESMNSEKKGAAIGKALLSGPYLIWMAGFTLIPLAMIIWYGLTDKGGGLTMANVIAIASADHAKALWLSLGLSLVSTVLCLLLAYPLAMILRGRGAAAGGFIVFIFILPMWMNFLLRTLAWQTLLEKNGVINGILNWLHLPSQSMINTPSAIVLGMVYNFLPFMVLPIYNVLSKIDDNIINAAMDLGANSFQRFTRIWFPLSIPGIISGITMVFVPSLTTFVISDLLGGSKILLIGNVIEQEFTRGSNWHLGSGLSLVLMVFILISMAMIAKYDKNGEGTAF